MSTADVTACLGGCRLLCDKGAVPGAAIKEGFILRMCFPHFPYPFEIEFLLFEKLPLFTITAMIMIQQIFVWYTYLCRST
jgi:hypothetical protein